MSRSVSLPEVLDKIERFEFSDPISQEQPLVVYGAGGFGRDVAQTLRGQGRSLIGFLDRRGAKEVDAIPCRSPEEDLSDWVKMGAIVLIGLHNYQVNPLAVRSELYARGFRRVLLPVEYYHRVEGPMGVRYWLGNQGIYRKHLAEFDKVFSLLADDKSKSILLSTLAYRALGDADAHPWAEPDQAYFPEDIPRWSEPLNWVDGGACDGDSLRAFPTDRYKCKNIYAFEPDPVNFEKLQSAIRIFESKMPEAKIESWAAGLGKQKGTLKFKTGLGLGSAAAVDGETTCSIVCLDEVLKDRPVNLIKLDIEGAEPEALLGAQQIIREQEPGLAICIYHKPEHLWEIPLVFAQRHPDYRFYLRCHGQSSFDLVLYAIPS